MQTRREVKNQFHSRSGLESPTTAGDSPVDEMNLTSWIMFPSTTGHVKPCGNLGGPPSKAKYSLVTDSEHSTGEGKVKSTPSRRVK